MGLAEETATIKAGAQRHASHHGVMLVMPDTSPRGAGIDGEDDDWDFGIEAGQELELRMQPGYDHSYYFIQTFMGDHVEHHARQLTGQT
jgi:S-formylglutathione hydrolase